MAAPTERGFTAPAAGLSATSPAGTQVGDIVVVFTWEVAGAGVPTHTLQSGFTEIRSQPHDDGSTDGRLSIAAKVAQSSGATSYQAYTSSVGTNTWTGIYVITAGTFETDVDAWPDNAVTQTNNAVPNPPSVTLDAAKDYLVLAFASWHFSSTGSLTPTAPTNYTLKTHVAPSALGDVALAVRTLADTGATTEDPAAYGDNLTPNGTSAITIAVPEFAAPAASGASSVSGGGGAAAAAAKAASASSSSTGGGGAQAAASSQRFGASSCRGGGTVASVGQQDEAGGLLTPELDVDLGTSTSTTFTFPTDVAADTRVLFGLWFYDDTKTLADATDNGPGLDWSVLVQRKHPDNGHRLAILSAYAPDGIASGTVLTPSYSGGGGAAFGPTFVGSSWLNLAETTFLEDFDSAGQYDATWSVPALTVTSEKILIYSVGMAAFNAAGGAHAATSPYTEHHEVLVTGSSTDKLVDLYDVVESTAAGSYTPGGTWSGGSGIAMQLEAGVAITPATGAGVPNVNGTSSVRGGGAASSSGTRGAAGASSIRGGGAAIAAAAKAAAGTSSVRGGGSGAGTGREGALSGTGVTGGGSVSSAGRKAATGASSVRGGGTVASSGTSQTPPPNVNGTSSVRGGGLVASIVAKSASQTSSVRGGGSLSAATSASRGSASTVTSGGRLFASASGQRRGASVVSAGGRLFAASSSSRSSTSSVRGGGFVTSTASSIPPAEPAITTMTRAGPAGGRTKTAIASGRTFAGSSTGGTGTMLEEG